MVSLALSKRAVFCDAFGNCTSSGFVNWGRWVLLGVLVVIFFIALLCSCQVSRRRVKQGSRPIYGTGWMVPPSYYQSQQQYHAPGAAPSAPPYHAQAQAGYGDAGYYDANGNFVQTHDNRDQYQNQYAGQYQNPTNAGNYYQPPPGPPQASGSHEDIEMNNYGAPNYPPNSHVKN